MDPEEFEGPALVLGAVRGRRSFGVAADGRLTGLYYAQVWHPGENRASCHHDDSVVVRRPDGQISVSWTTTRDIGPGHGLQGCTCGFYAYYHQDPYARAGRVSGVVEGYGRVVLGTAGFRCEKARILGLLVPGVPWPGRAPDDGVPSPGVVDAARLGAAYPGVPLFSREEDLLAACPPTPDGPEL